MLCDERPLISSHLFTSHRQATEAVPIADERMLEEGSTTREEVKELLEFEEDDDDESSVVIVEGVVTEGDGRIATSHAATREIISIDASHIASVAAFTHDENMPIIKKSNLDYDKK